MKTKYLFIFIFLCNGTRCRVHTLRRRHDELVGPQQSDPLFPVSVLPADPLVPLRRGLPQQRGRAGAGHGAALLAAVGDPDGAPRGRPLGEHQGGGEPLVRAARGGRAPQRERRARHGRRAPAHSRSRSRSRSRAGAIRSTTSRSTSSSPRPPRAAAPVPLVLKSPSASASGAEAPPSRASPTGSARQAGAGYLPPTSPPRRTVRCAHGEGHPNRADRRPRGAAARRGAGRPSPAPARPASDRPPSAWTSSTPTAVCRRRASPAPGGPTCTSTSRSTSGPPVRSIRMALAMRTPPRCAQGVAAPARRALPRQGWPARSASDASRPRRETWGMGARTATAARARRRR